MNRDDAKIIENILYDYPYICLRLSEKTKELESPFGPDAIGLVQGGARLPEQERILMGKAGNVEYCELTAITESTHHALQEAPEEIQEVVERLFFQREHISLAALEMGFSERNLWLKRYKAVSYMKSTCLDLYKLVVRWREREEKRRKQALRMASCFSVDNLCKVCA